jgi:hypothetical protein
VINWSKPMMLTMEGRLDECLLLSYRAPADSVQYLLPEGLHLVTHDHWAFWNIVLCHIDSMRPAGTPRMLGLSYHHVAYRLFVRAKTAGGQTIDGLYFVRSDADSLLVSEFGNLASDFRFHAATVEQLNEANNLIFEVRDSENGIGDARLRVDLDIEPRLAEGSCFESFDEARAFLKYRPLGLACDSNERRLKFAEVFRDESKWDEKAISVVESQWNFFDHLKQNEVQLELATRVAPIDYRWRLGRNEPLA